MSDRRVLVTGGAGFVGSHLVDALVERGDRVTVVDSLDPQVHGPDREVPEWLSPRAELIRGDVRDRDVWDGLLTGVDVIYHLAAAVGVGQSMYQVADYTETNTQGTANLLQALIDQDLRPRLVVASSMSIYGEGRYRRPDGRAPIARRREPEALRRRDWELRDPDGTELIPAPTPEDEPLDPTSIYALTKKDQETMSLLVGEAYGIPTTALRFFNIYGPRQALSNPYTGVVAIFSSRLLNGEPPLIYEDGAQRRDFVSVHDIVRALVLTAESPAAVGEVLNVASGQPVTIVGVARQLAALLGVDAEPEVTGRYRVGDIRHCTADIGRARRLLGYEPEVTLEEGLQELLAWLRAQRPPESKAGEHVADLASRGLAI
ncbi:MAG: NAD-dependent epimerase/dehydratase family protein [Gemmatimonadota bacterium]